MAEWRHVKPGEIKEADRVFNGKIKYETVRIYEGRYMPFQPDTTAMAPNGWIYFPTKIYLPNFAGSPRDMALLVHELGHVWQVQSGVWLKFRRVIWEKVIYSYGKVDANRTLQSYTVEQQASIIADYYCVLSGIGTIHGNGSAQDYQTIVNRAMPA